MTEAQKARTRDPLGQVTSVDSKGALRYRHISIEVPQEMFDEFDSLKRRYGTSRAVMLIRMIKLMKWVADNEDEVTIRGKGGHEVMVKFL